MAREVRHYLTPPEMLAALDAEFRFDFDPAPFPRPAGFDGLVSPWGRVNYLNPPYGVGGGTITAWTRKAIAEPGTTIAVLPVPIWLRELLDAGAILRPLPAFAWMDPSGDPKRPRHPAPPSVLAILQR